MYICKQVKLFKYLWTSLKGEVLEKMAWLLAFTRYLYNRPRGHHLPSWPLPAYCLVVLEVAAGRGGRTRGFI
jgi:hypothetical protein